MPGNTMNKNFAGIGFIEKIIQESLILGLYKV